MKPRTKTTREAELRAFEELPDSYIIRGALRTLYGRHKYGVDMSMTVVVGLLGWGLIAYRFFA